MARSQARIQTTIWHDPDFLALTGQAQRIYFLALSQGQVNFCGVVPYTAKRWARLATNSTVKEVTKAIRELIGARFVIVDEDTEELFIRSFAKNDGVLKSPNLVVAMGRDFQSIHSEHLREAFIESLPEGFPDGLPKGLVEGLPEPFRRASRVRSAEPSSSYLLPPSSSSAGDAIPSTSEQDKGADDDEDLKLEAKRRYDVARQHHTIADPEAWMRAACSRLKREGWKPAAKAEAPTCSLCKDQPLAEPCPDCGRSAA